MMNDNENSGSAASGKPAGPVGTGDYVVRQGDCISSIAVENGHFWKTLWNHSANAEVRRVRGNPNVLRPGDRLHVPPIAPKEVSKPTEQRHRFRRKGEPSQIRLVLKQGGVPRANQEYVLDIDGKLTRGTTDANGEVRISIPGNAKSGKIVVGPDEEEFPLQLGHIDPIEELSGIQGRLNNLGYDAGEVDGELNQQTVAALQRFQKDHDLPETGNVDEQTRSKIKEVHGS